MDFRFIDDCGRRSSVDVNLIGIFEFLSSNTNNEPFHF